MISIESKIIKLSCCFVVVAPALVRPATCASACHVYVSSHGIWNSTTGIIHSSRDVQ
jgi:hypothetical protein